MIPIFRAELEAGIADKVKSSGSIAYYNKLLPISREGDLAEKIVKASMDLFGKEVQREGLYPTQSVLVSTVWNLNDDVFEPAEVWAARNSPVDRPTNLNHNENIIVGHITGNVPIDMEGNVIAEDTVVEDLPALFHLLNNAVIYTVYSEKEKLEQINKLISEIEAGTKYVSMECLFKNFDYAVVKPDGTQCVISRGEESAFLTKHLRVYGGTGQYENHKIGRILRGITFIGKGYVDNPANPASVIIPNESVLSFSAKSKLGVLSIQSESNKKENEMTIEELTKANDELKAKLAEAEAKAKEDKIALETSAAKVVELEKSKTEAEKKAADLSVELAKVQAEKTKANRITLLVEGGFDKEKAEKKVAAFTTLTDEQFKEVAEELLAAIKTKTAEITAEDLAEAAKKAAAEKLVTTPSTDEEKTKAAKLEQTRASVSELFAKTFASNAKTKKENK